MTNTSPGASPRSSSTRPTRRRPWPSCRRCRSVPDPFEIRRLARGDLGALDRLLPIWNRTEYTLRLRAQGEGKLTQLVAWSGEVPLGRGMVLFPEHPEFSVSAVREGCADVRDVFVAEPFRRRGIARALMGELELAAREVGMRRIGMAVGLDLRAAPARALYRELGYRLAHGPFIAGATLDGEEGSIPVGAILTYLVKDL